MAGLATQETDLSVDAYINNIASASKKEDSKILLQMMEEISGYSPKIWGDNFLVGFGKYQYQRKGGKEVYEWFHLGFAARKTKITIYLTFNLKNQEDLLHQLGKCKWGSGCLYINKLADIDLEVLKKIITMGKESQWH